MSLVLFQDSVTSPLFNRPLVILFFLHFRSKRRLPVKTFSLSFPSHVEASLRGATTFSIMTLSMMTFSMKGLFAALSINDIQHNNTIECHYDVCCFAECHHLFIFMLNVIMLSVVILNVVMLSVGIYLLLYRTPLC